MNRLIIAVLALLSLIAIAASTFVSLPPIFAQPATPAKPGGTWRTHACGDCVFTLAVTADAVWAGTHAAGVIRHDRRDGSVRQFTSADGLGGNSVREVAVGPDGDVWVATRITYMLSPATGISHYDGRTWRVYDTGDGLPDNTVVAIAPGKSGTAWIATPHAVAFFDGQRWQAYTVADGLPLDNLSAVVLDGAGGVYVATGTGIAHFDGQRWATLPVDGLPMPWTSMRALGLGTNGEIWAIVGPGVGHYNPRGWPATGEHWIFEDLGIPFDGQTGSFRCDIGLDASGRVWIVQDVSAWRMDGGQWSQIHTAEQHVAAVGAHPSQLRIDTDGCLWLSFNTRGIARWDGNRWIPTMSHIGPTSLIALGITAGPGDAVWTGLFPLLDQDNHLNRFDGTRWTGFGQADGLPKATGAFGGNLNTIDADSSGTAWVGIDAVGLAWYDGQRWASKAITDVVGVGARIRSVDADDRGGVWAGTSSGAIQYDGGTWRVFSTADGLPANNVQAVRVEPRAGTDVVWFGTDAGLTRWDGATWRTYTTADGLASNRVYDIALDPRTRDLWLVHGPGTGGPGITRFDGTRGHVFTTADGLAANNAWDIEVDAWGEVWVATMEENNPPGISRFDGRRWVVYTTADGLSDNIAFDLAVDSKGTVWIATIAGISEFRPDRVPAPEPTPTVEPEPGPCVCGIVQDRVPRAAIDAAVANPASVGGWQVPLDPGKPAGPFNPRRECLSLSRSSVPYHPLYNGLEWHAGCP
jgi:ligand-binding sensor domain-containing protein